MLHCKLIIYNYITLGTHYNWLSLSSEERAATLTRLVRRAVWDCNKSVLLHTWPRVSTRARAHHHVPRTRSCTGPHRPATHGLSSTILYRSDTQGIPLRSPTFLFFRVELLSPLPARWRSRNYPRSTAIKPSRKQKGKEKENGPPFFIHSRYLLIY